MGAGHLTGISLLLKGPWLCLSSADGIKPCLFPASLILAPKLNAHLAFSLTCLLPNASLSLTTAATAAWQLHAVPLLIPFSHCIANLGNTWVGCQPARVVKVTFKLQLCKLEKMRLLPPAAERTGVSAECLFWTFTLVKKKRISEGDRGVNGDWISKHEGQQEKIFKWINKKEENFQDHSLYYSPELPINTSSQWDYIKQNSIKPHSKKLIDYSFSF